eukprot:SAG11_NODE_234_length_11857_cov_15.265776_7_plen_172_part_00
MLSTLRSRADVFDSFGRLLRESFSDSEVDDQEKRRQQAEEDEELRESINDCELQVLLWLMHLSQNWSAACIFVFFTTRIRATFSACTSAARNPPGRGTYVLRAALFPQSMRGVPTAAEAAYGLFSGRARSNPFRVCKASPRDCLRAGGNRCSNSSGFEHSSFIGCFSVPVE